MAVSGGDRRAPAEARGRLEEEQEVAQRLRAVDISMAEMRHEVQRLAAENHRLACDLQAPGASDVEDRFAGRRARRQCRGRLFARSRDLVLADHREPQRRNPCQPSNSHRGLTGSPALQGMHGLSTLCMQECPLVGSSTMGQVSAASHLEHVSEKKCGMSWNPNCPDHTSV